MRLQILEDTVLGLAYLIQKLRQDKSIALWKSTEDDAKDIQGGFEIKNSKIGEHTLRYQMHQQLGKKFHVQYCNSPAQVSKYFVHLVVLPW